MLGECVEQQTRHWGTSNVCHDRPPSMLRRPALTGPWGEPFAKCAKVSGNPPLRTRLPAAHVLRASNARPPYCRAANTRDALAPFRLVRCQFSGELQDIELAMVSQEVSERIYKPRDPERRPAPGCSHHPLGPGRGRSRRAGAPSACAEPAFLMRGCGGTR